MKNLRELVLILIIIFTCSIKTPAQSAWVNDLRSLFQNNNAIIYAINIRTFNAQDLNGNGLIELEKGEESGNFINAIDRLDELRMQGINTLHVLPVTSIGKTKALGTAGSLYAAASFEEINPQLKSKKSNLSTYEQMQKFVLECHKRNIRVIVDLPSCGAYDLYLKNPSLFAKDQNQSPIIPADWTDVRLLNAGDNIQINQEVYLLYKNFIKMMLDIDIDGIRADVATIKPFTFWKNIIDETRRTSPQFLFLAETSPDWRIPPSDGCVFTPYNKLLEAGFDGYYANYFNLKNWKTSKDLILNVKEDLKIRSNYLDLKSAIGSFATHDEVSPLLINGINMSKMIIWLNATLPLNAYYVDGFSRGDTYTYPWANKKAIKTYTDDDYYFIHRGKLDIFNFSAKPNGKHDDILQDFIFANRFKMQVSDIVSKGSFIPLKTNSPKVFAYARIYKEKSIIVIGNLDYSGTVQAEINVPKLTSETLSVPIKLGSIPTLHKNKIKTELKYGEIQVLYLNNPEIK